MLEEMSYSSGRLQLQHLLKPLELNGGAVTLRNRVLMGSMHTGLEDTGLFPRKLDKLAGYFKERARGGVGLMVTGGIAPNNAGRTYYLASKMTNRWDMASHRVVPEAVHEEGGKICMQILHTGRYGYHHWLVGPSPIRAPIGMFTPRVLSSRDVYSTIRDFVRCAELAKQAGYDGVEIMGSEGYLINEFICSKTNKRTDEWGGSYENRIRLPIEIVRQTRKACGDDFIIIYRLSMLDLVDGGSSWEEIEQLALSIESAGASIINTGIGWHEARVPTIATLVPRGGFSWVTKRLKGSVNIPLCTTNRINMPSIAEQILRDGYADMVSMARPLLADPMWVRKAEEGRDDLINTCIGCNQACLDHVFQNKRASCLVNPRAGYETELNLVPVASDKKMKIAVVGAGPAGLACAVSAAARGHQVTLFERDGEIGGQFNMAKRIPTKSEFYETIRYFGKQIEIHGVNLRLNTSFTPDMVESEGYGCIVVATGVVPRRVAFEGIDHPKLLGYIDVLKRSAHVGKRVAVIGAGGIGFDVAEYLTDSHTHEPTPGREGPPSQIDEREVAAFCQQWGVDMTQQQPGGLVSGKAFGGAPREVYLLQRKKGKVGAGLGKTTGWIHRTNLKMKNVTMLDGCRYVKVDDRGLTVEIKGKETVLEVDNVILCAGQESLNELDEVKSMGVKWFTIGGALLASELDAKRAIDQGTRLAAVIESAESGQVFNQPEPQDITHKLLSFVQRIVGK